MDWVTVAAISSGVVVPTVSCGVLIVKVLYNQQIDLIEQRFKLILSENNTEMLRLINGTYVRKEALADKIKIAVADSYSGHEEVIDGRVRKLELDIGNITASIARRSADFK